MARNVRDDSPIGTILGRGFHIKNEKKPPPRRSGMGAHAGRVKGVKAPPGSVVGYSVPSLPSARSAERDGRMAMDGMRSADGMPPSMA